MKRMEQEAKKKKDLPEKLQIEMMKFFLKTSIPRKIREQQKTKGQEQSPTEIKS